MSFVNRVGLTNTATITITDSDMSVVDGHLREGLVDDGAVLGAVINPTDGKLLEHSYTGMTGTGVDQVPVRVITDDQDVEGSMRREMEATDTVVFCVDRDPRTMLREGIGTPGAEYPSSLLGGDRGVCDGCPGIGRRWYRDASL